MQTEPKNIVVCCDGTGNQFGECNSNVVKIYTMLRVNERQVAYYHPGLGTMGAPNRSSWLGKKLSQIGGLAFGAGFEEYLGDAYQFLMREYKDGDHIYLFGFSRGAYTVRALAGALHAYGLLCPGNEGHLSYLLRLYSNASRKAYSRNRKQIPSDPISEAFKATFSRTISVHFVGLWDTVSSVGWIYDPVKLLYDGQNPIMHIGRHAVSIDEHRCFFQNNLWGSPLTPDETPTLEGKQQDILQAWFAGVHSDVGGSYLQRECAPAIDALKWIVNEAESAGLVVHEEKRKAVYGEPTKEKALSKIYPPPEPFTRLHESLKSAWWLLEIFPHKYFDDQGIKHWQFAPWAHRRELPDGALLHPSVEDRLTHDPNYRPKNLAAGRIDPIRTSPVRSSVPQLEEQVAETSFFVYRAEAVRSRSIHSPVRVSIALAGLGLLWSLLHRFTSP